MSLRGKRCPAWVSNKDLADAAEHFRKAYPYEGVGFLTDTGFAALENISKNPRTEFDVDGAEWLNHGKVLAVLHSHVKVPVETDTGTKYIHASPAPSSGDMYYQKSWGVPGGIMVSDDMHTGEVVWFGDQLEKPPIFGREFVHGITDCYSLIRDMYAMGKVGLIASENPAEHIYNWPFDPIDLMEMPRDDAWWERKGVNLYMDHFIQAGFEKLPVDRTNLQLLQISDIFFYKLGRTQVPNHAGIYIGNNLVLHHVPGFSSMTAPLHLYGHGAECWIRYVPK
jgi:cell wall-associated NlpC family hydrolase